MIISLEPSLGYKVEVMNEQRIFEAMQAIKLHLIRAPMACDTVHGIHTWWVDWTEPIPDLAVTEQALQRLEEEGAVERVGIGESVLWRRRKEIDTDTDTATSTSVEDH